MYPHQTTPFDTARIEHRSLIRQAELHGQLYAEVRRGSRRRRRVRRRESDAPL